MPYMVCSPGNSTASGLEKRNEFDKVLEEFFQAQTPWQGA